MYITFWDFLFLFCFGAGAFFSGGFLAKVMEKNLLSRIYVKIIDKYYHIFIHSATFRLRGGKPNCI